MKTCMTFTPHPRTTYLMKAYSYTHYDHDEEVTLRGDKAKEWLDRQLLKPRRKVVVYTQDNGKWCRTLHRHMGKKKWVKFTEVLS
jgi:hypothetical protein